ncbi:MAG: NAD(+) synthase [Candidatus Ozemobacteraceae bacterium]
MQHSFLNLYRHGFVRVAAAVPAVRPAAPRINADRLICLARKAHEDGVAVLVFPELSLTGYSNEDLFQQQTLLESAERELARLARETSALSPILFIGMPLAREGFLFNVAVALYQGRPLAVFPKMFLPNYREFYEKRQFASGASAPFETVRLLDQEAVPFGSQILLHPCLARTSGSDLTTNDSPAPQIPQILPYSHGLCESFLLHAEICEDLWAPIPPSSHAALAGAMILVNLSASNCTVGKAAYRRALCASQSARSLAGYVYSAAGQGESTTDLAWDGHGMIFENGVSLSETKRFADQESLITGDIDLEKLVQERRRFTTFQDAAIRENHLESRFRRVSFAWTPPTQTVRLRREIGRFPYVPDSVEERNERCAEACRIQTAGLTQRLRSSGIMRPVIGISGGLDSTQALLIAVRAMDLLGKPRSEIIGVTMPGFATSARTHENARALMSALGVTVREIDIRPSCRQMLSDIEHPFASGKPVYDITFENVQAGERTSHLFRMANALNGLVMGTGDLSELALGWCTYGVGDHMSHYNVNASVPKTLIQHLIRWVVKTDLYGPVVGDILTSILETEISPELVPVGQISPEPVPVGQIDFGREKSVIKEAARDPLQKTEASIGPFELQDFHLYWVTRFGFRPSKVAFLAHEAWGNPASGSWPPDFPLDKRHEYDLATIRHWLGIFLERFFHLSQFKRSCVPNGPKVGSGGSLSPRGDWRAPSDIDAGLWLEELRENVPDCLEKKPDGKV